MELAISTPALLFPAITILILTYSNRFSTLSNRIREFIRKAESTEQINVFKTRIMFVRKMLLWGIAGLIFSSISMLYLAFSFKISGMIAFIAADVSIVMSLQYAFRDVLISTHALEIELRDK